MAKIDSIYDISDKALVELKSWLQPWFPDIDTSGGAAAPLPPFYNAVASLASTRDLLGYWRLGEGGLGPYADTSGSTWTGHPFPMIRTASGTAMTDLGTGALPLSDDDGAIQFNNSTGAASDYLSTTTTWGTGANNRFQNDVGTIAGWVNPKASASTFQGAVVSLYGIGGGFEAGWVLGVDWPTLRVFHRRSTLAPVTLYGPVLPANEWSFVVGVKDSTSTRIYVNGALTATGAAQSGASGFNLPPKIGLRDLVSLQTIYGGVDEVSVWDGALTDDEIALLAASGGRATDSTVRAIIHAVGNYTALPNETVLGDGTITVTLPTAVGNLGAVNTVKNIAAGTVTVAQAGSETIDGSATDLTLNPADSVEMVSDGAGWQIIASYSYP